MRCAPIYGLTARADDALASVDCESKAIATEAPALPFVNTIRGTKAGFTLL